MATNFPTSLDNFTNPAPGDVVASALIGNMADAVEALEAKAGTGAQALPGAANQYGYDLATGCGTTVDRALGVTAATVSSGVLYLSYFRAPKSFTANTVRWILTTGAAATPTITRWGIYSVTEADGALVALIGSTANDTVLLTTGASNSVFKTKALQAGTPLVQGTFYALGLLVVTGAANPTVAQVVAANVQQGLANSSLPRLSGSVSGQTDLPASLAAGSVAIQNTRLFAELV